MSRRQFTAFENFSNDVRLATRRLRRTPAVTIVSIVALALGIAASASSWSFVSSVMFEPLHVADADSLVVIGRRLQLDDGTSAVENSHTYTRYTAVQETGIFDSFGAGGSWPALVGFERPEEKVVDFVSHNLFDVLGVNLAIGRGFSSADDRRSAPLVAILSNRYWRQVFESDPSILGQRIIVSGKSAVVVGIAPAEFRGLNLADPPDLYMPLHAVADVVGGANPGRDFFADNSQRDALPSQWITLIARLSPGASRAEAATRLTALLADRDLPSRGTYFFTQINEAAIPEGARAGTQTFSQLLAITVGLLFFVGCSAVAVLLLIRTEKRREEFAMCLALGGSSTRLIGGIVVEAALLALGGALLAMPITYWIFRGVAAFELPGGVQMSTLNLSLDAAAFATTIGAAVVVTVLIALIAYAFIASVSLGDTLRSRVDRAAYRTHSSVRRFLVVSQVAISLVLLGATGLFIQSLRAGSQLNLGYESERILTGTVNLLQHGYTQERSTLFFRELRERLTNSPLIGSVGLGASLGGVPAGGELILAGERRNVPSRVAFKGVDEGYLPTMGLRVTRGRGFLGSDSEGSRSVAIVSESLAQVLGDDGIGARIRMPYAKEPGFAEVVGVVRDIVTDVRDTSPLVAYLPISQVLTLPNREIVVRGLLPDNAVASAEAMTAIRSVDEAVIPKPMLTIQERLNEQLATQRFGLFVMGGLGIVATVLTALVIYVSAEFLVSSQKRELAIRSALGATSTRLGWSVVVETVRSIGVGILIGLILASIGADTIQAFLFQVDAMNFGNLASVSSVLLILALAVSLRSVFAAMRVDVAKMLREL